jgi:hypothetical protein
VLGLEYHCDDLGKRFATVPEGNISHGGDSLILADCQNNLVVIAENITQRLGERLWFRDNRTDIVQVGAVETVEFFETISPLEIGTSCLYEVGVIVEDNTQGVEKFRVLKIVPLKLRGSFVQGGMALANPVGERFGVRGFSKSELCKDDLGASLFIGSHDCSNRMIEVIV